MEKWDIFEDIITKKLYLFSIKYNYKLEVGKIVTDSLGYKHYTVRYVNKKILRELSFNFLINFPEENIIAGISNMEKDNYLSIEEILKYEQKKYDGSKFSLTNYEGDFEEKVNAFCNFIIQVFENDIKDWILGEKWDEILFDWGGYR